jgi:hypothetical protein
MLGQTWQPWLLTPPGISLALDAALPIEGKVETLDAA